MNFSIRHRNLWVSGDKLKGLWARESGVLSTHHLDGMVLDESVVDLKHLENGSRYVHASRCLQVPID